MPDPVDGAGAAEVEPLDDPDEPGEETVCDPLHVLEY